MTEQQGQESAALAEAVRTFLALPVMARAVSCGPEWGSDWVKDCLRNEMRCSDVQAVATALARYDAASKPNCFRLYYDEDDAVRCGLPEGHEPPCGQRILGGKE